MANEVDLDMCLYMVQRMAKGKPIVELAEKLIAMMREDTYRSLNANLKTAQMAMSSGLCEYTDVYFGILIGINMAHASTNEKLIKEFAEEKEKNGPPAE